nr:MAG TPA: hypothetical protein [Caudoviricetes sp.]
MEHRPSLSIAGGGAFSCYRISVSMLFNVMHLTSNSPHLSAISFV